MNKEDVYTYFKLDSQLFMAITNWIHKVVKDSYYDKTPYRIINYALIDGGCIGLRVLFLTDEESIGIEEYYRINIKELEEC